MNYPKKNTVENFLFDSSGKDIFRGFSHDSPDFSIEFPSPKNRQPKDTPENIHLEMDNWFFEKFGMRFRSQATFVTGSLFVASNYGNVRKIVPLEDYYFCWSKISKDLFGQFQIKSEFESIESMMNRLNFQCDDLNAAISSGNEIMIICQKFSAIKL